LRVFFYLAAALVIVLAMFHVSTTEERNSLLDWGAFLVIIGMAGAQFCLSLVGAAGPRVAARARDAEEVLKHTMGKIFDAGIVPQDFSLVSMHVWMVPIGYRITFPFKLRKSLHAVFSENVPRFKPSLKHLACFKLGHHESSGVSFEKGYGLVGRCLDDSLPNPLWADFREPRTLQALAAGKNEWRDESRKITHGLKYEDAKRLAGAYSQAIACPIKERGSGEVIGVLTFETGNGYGNGILHNAALRGNLVDLAGILSPVVSVRKKKE
jgi:hypothetical protein